MGNARCDYEWTISEAFESGWRRVRDRRVSHSSTRVQPSARATSPAKYYGFGVYDGAT
jgi:hypothetical protein